MTKTYNMGHTRKHVFPTPSKIRFTEHNGRTICANPSGVPAKWLPVYFELASRMYDNGPSFAIGKDENERGNPVTLRLKDECGSWSTIGDPTDAARILEMNAPTKPAPTPRKVAAPKPVIAHAQEVSVLAEHTARPIAQPTSQAMAQLPTWAEEWLAGLVFEAKRDYARQFLAHLLCDAPAPIDPATEWAEKARKRARRLTELAVAS